MSWLRTLHTVSISFLVYRLLRANVIVTLKPTSGPTVGLAVSGGGFRASLVGAGIFNAFDGRNKTAVKAGTGGILQLASYMTGLSGGAWFVSSLAINSFPTLHDLILGSPKHQG